MKLSRLFAILIPLLLLASCSEEPKKPVNPSSTSTSTTASTSTVNPYVRHLSLDEVIETFDSASQTIKNISKANITDFAMESTLNDSTGDMDKKEFKLTEVSTLFTNSVIFSTYTASNVEKIDEYSKFGRYDATYGPQIEQYIAFSDAFDKINTINVFKAIGASNKKNVVISEDATLVKADEKFKILDSRFTLIDPSEVKDKLVTFAVDTKGYYEIVYKNVVENTVSEIKTTTIEQKTYKFQSGQLFFEKVEKNYKEIKNEIVQKETSMSYSAEFTYSSNGGFDRSKLPEAN